MEKENVVIKNSVMLSLTQHLQRLWLPLLNDMRGRSRIKYGMTPLFSNSGFTLIELLVVVLIIGILAAVAVPQYQKAVHKARVAEAKVILKQLTDAQDAWFLEGSDNELWSISEWNEVLSIEFPTQTVNWQFELDECSYGGSSLGCNNVARPRWENASYEIFYASPNYDDTYTPGHFYCRGDEDICTSLGGVDPIGDGITFLL